MLRISLVLAPLAASLTALVAQRPPMPAAFRTTARMVLVPVTVTDHSGKTILGLQAKDFSIFDDQAQQQIASFSSEDTPSAVGVVLDTSGSMRNALRLAKDGAAELVRAANAEDEFLLLTVATEPAAGTAFSSSSEDLERSISSTAPGGLTALIDTVYLGLHQMKKAHRAQRALVVFSDGMDNHSRYTKGQLLDAALEADVQIYTIVLDGLIGSSTGTAPFRPSMIAKPGDLAAAQQQGPALLETLADKTGGLHFHARNAAEARESVAKIGAALRNEYVIGYQPAAPGVPGKSHRIRVTTSVPKVYVHARTSYFATE